MAIKGITAYDTTLAPNTAIQAAAVKSGTSIVFGSVAIEAPLPDGSVFGETGGPTGISKIGTGHGRIQVAFKSGVTGTVDVWEVANTNTGDIAISLSNGVNVPRIASKVANVDL